VGAEPGFGGAEVAGDGDRGDAEDGGDLFGGHAAEVTHFQGLGFAAVEDGEGVEGFVEGEQGGGLAGEEVFDALQVEGTAALAAFEGEAFTGEVDEDLAHEAGGDEVEVRAVSPIGLALLGEAEVGFVDEFGGGEFAIVAEGEAGTGELTEFGIDDSGEGVGGSGVAGSPEAEKLSDGAWGGGAGRVWLRPIARIEHHVPMRKRIGEMVMGVKNIFARGGGGGGRIRVG